MAIGFQGTKNSFPLWPSKYGRSQRDSVAPGKECRKDAPYKRQLTCIVNPDPQGRASSGFQKRSGQSVFDLTILIPPPILKKIGGPLTWKKKLLK